MDNYIPTQEETLGQIGCLLLLTQSVEHTIGMLIGLAYPAGKPTWEELEKLNEKTLGALISKLKERVEIEDSFVGLLEGFRQQRNLFVHHLNRQSWFDMESEEGRDKIWVFLESYQKFLTEVLMVVTAAHFKNMEDVGFETEEHSKLRETGFLELLENYYPKARIAFKAKRTS